MPAFPTQWGHLTNSNLSSLKRFAIYRLLFVRQFLAVYVHQADKYIYFLMNQSSVGITHCWLFGCNIPRCSQLFISCADIHTGVQSFRPPSRIGVSNALGCYFFSHRCGTRLFDTFSDSPAYQLTRCGPSNCTFPFSLFLHIHSRLRL